MKIKFYDEKLTVCKLKPGAALPQTKGLLFFGQTDDERSLVCRTDCVPAETIAREDGWCAFRIEGVLDFSLTGILAEVSAVLAKAKIGIFAVSTYNTDYILIKEERRAEAAVVLAAAGWTAD